MLGPGFGDEQGARRRRRDTLHSFSRATAVGEQPLTGAGWCRHAPSWARTGEVRA